MKVVHIINSLEIGGAENLLVNLANAQVKLGHELYIITLFKNNTNINIEKLDKRINLLEFKSKDRISIKLSLKLRKTLLRISPDVVHSHLAYPIINLLPYYVNFFRKENRMHTMHGATKIEFPSILRYIYIFYIFVLKLKIIAISEHVKEDVKKDYFYISEVIYNGVPEYKSEVLDQSLIKTIDQIKNKDYKKIYVSVGRINKIKNQLELVKAFSSESLENYGLVIVGPIQDQGYFEDVQKVASDNIYFIGPQDCVVDVIKNFDRFILPSRHEGLGISAIEAMQAKVPIVCSRVGGLVELVKDGRSGFFIEGLKSEDIVLSVKKLESLSAQDLAYVAEEAFKLYKQKFSLEECVRRYEEFYVQDSK